MSDKILAAIDIGAGQGAKFGLFTTPQSCIAEAMLRNHHYGETAEEIAEALTEQVDRMLKEKNLTRNDVAAVGVASPGLFKADGTYLLADNIPALTGHNLKAMIEEKIQLPVEIDNDANAGGLAEWEVLRVEILYWVFGGGWGGAWISKDGELRYPAVDWDGDDASLHYSNEPGYAIGLEKTMLKQTFDKMNVSFERFEQLLLEEIQPEDGVIRGPNGSADHIRAEIILSGPGRCRLFRAIVGDDDFYERFLDIHEASEMNDPAVAGQHISKLSSMRVESAVDTDRLFGKILAIATRTIMRASRDSGMVETIPICLGGKPSYALPYFGPSAQRALGAMGIMSYLRPSVIDERGSNANLVGAAVLARKAAEL
ncbi:MAG: ROK family protein [Planctomycetota bacterium]|jgi:hypothetical protein